MIDATNHLTLYGTSFIRVDPSQKYPYGKEKMKNFVVLIPAFLFFYFGSETIYHAIHDYYLLNNSSGV